MVYGFRKTLGKCLALVLLSIGASSALASNTTVSYVSYKIEPHNPAANQAFTLTATIHGEGSGQPCQISNIRATIQGASRVAQPSDSGSTHGTQRSLTRTFSFSNIGSGSLAPTFSFDTSKTNGKGPCGSSSGITTITEGNTPPPSIQPAPQPSLGITKTRTSASQDVVPGELVTYKITVTNSGQGNASGITISDQLSSHLLFQSATGGTTSVPPVGSSGTVTWSLGSLLGGHHKDFNLTVRIADDGYAGTVGNKATLKRSGVADRDSNNVSVTVHRDPKITLRKTVNGSTETSATLPAGTFVSYQLHYENVGFSDASDIVITDRIPDEITGTPLLQGGDRHTWDAINRIATWYVDDVVAGDGLQVGVSGTIDPTLTAADFDNQASVSWGNGAGSGVSNVVNVIVKPEPNFEITKKADQDHASPGARVNVELKFTNIGGIAGEDVKVIDYLPVGVIPVAGSYGAASYSAADRTLTWTLGRIERGQPTKLSYAFDIAADAPPGEATNIAILSASNLPRQLEANAKTSIDVAGVVDLVAHKVLLHPDQDRVGDGADVTFQIWVENKGNLDTEGGVVLTDVLPSYFDYQNRSQGWTESSTSILALPIADIPAGGRSGTYSLTLKVDGTGVPDGSILENQVEVTNTTAGVDYNHISDPARVRYNLPPKITLVKTATPDPSKPVFPGDVIDYVLTASLDTLVGVDDLEVGDVLPIGLTFEGSIDSGYTLSTLPDGRQLVSWPATSLQSGQREYHLRARVDAGLSLGTALENKGVARYNNAWEESAVTHHVTEAAISFSKSRSDSQAKVIPGEVIRYEITYTNTGKIPLTGINLTDNLPLNTALELGQPAPDSISNGGSTLQWQLPPLDPGRSNTVLVSINTDNVQVGDVLTNKAFVTTNETKQQSAKAVSEVRASPQLEVTKTADVGVAYPGDTVTFTLHYANTGKGSAQDVVLVDKVPDALDFKSSTDQMSPDGNGLVSWNLGTLKPGASGTKLIKMTVPAAGQFVPAVTVDNLVALVSQKDADVDLASLTLTELPSFIIEKHEGVLAPDAVGLATPGDTLHYVIDVQKFGGAATDVMVADLLPDHASFVIGSNNYPLDPTRSDIDAGLLFWEVGDLPEGDIGGQIKFDVVVDTVVDNGEQLVNRAGLSSTETGSQLSNEVVTEISSQPFFSLVKSQSKDTLFSPATPAGGSGDSVTYYLAVENFGDADATDITVSDYLPKELIIDPSSTTGTVSGQTVTWSIPELKVGVPVTLAVSARVANGIAEYTPLSNKASLTTTMPGVGGTSSNEVIARVTGEPVLSLAKQTSAKSLVPGEQFSYTLTYFNRGTKTSDALRIEDDLPSYVSFVSASRGGVQDPSQPGTVVWDNLAPVAPGSADSVEVVVQVLDVVPDGTTLRNTAILSQITDPTVSIPSVPNVKPPTISSGPVLELTKVALTGDMVAAGDLTVFEIVVVNLGGDDATNLELTDKLPPGFTFVDATGTYSEQGGTITWMIPVMPAKQVAVLQVTAQAAASLENGHSLINRASLTASELKLPLVATKEITVRNAALSISKSASAAVVNSGVSTTGQPGDTLVYQLDYENTGDLDATNVIMEDVLPAEVILLDSYPYPDQIDGQKLTWNLGTVAQYATSSVIVKTQVGDDIPDGTIIHNAALISSDTTGTTKSNDVDIPVISQGVLVIEKSSTQVSVGAGETLVYDITLRNIGSDAVANVEVTENLPANVGFDSATAGGTHSGEALGGSITWSIPNDLPPGDELILHVKVTVATDVFDGDTLFNRVSAVGKTPAGVTLPTVSDNLTIPVVGDPVFELRYGVNRATTAEGFSLVYTAYAHNVGNADAVNATLRASVPPNTQVTNIAAGGRLENGFVVWNTALLPPTGPIELAFSVIVLETASVGELLQSKASLTADNAAPKSGEARTRVLGTADLEVTKVGPRLFSPGDNMTYTIIADNAGAAAAPGVILVDQLPVGTTFISAEPAPSRTVGQFVEWQLGNILPGEVKRITMEVSTDPGLTTDKLDNIVQISDAFRDSAVSDWESRAEPTTTLDITITPDSPTKRPGELVTFLVVWENTGNTDTSGTVVSATIPPNSSLESIQDNGASIANRVEWTVGDLAHGASGTATFTAKVSPSTATGSHLDSMAAITADLGVPVSSSTRVDIIDVPVLIMSKAVDVATAGVGDRVVYTIGFQNVGGAPLTGLTLSDVLPEGLEAVSASDGGVISADGKSVTWSIADVPPGGGYVATLEADVVSVSASVATNTVTLTSRELPPASEQATLALISPAAAPVPVPIDRAWLLGLLAVMLGYLGYAVIGRRSFVS